MTYDANAVSELELERLREFKRQRFPRAESDTYDQDDHQRLVRR